MGSVTHSQPDGVSQIGPAKEQPNNYQNQNEAREHPPKKKHKRACQEHPSQEINETAPLSPTGLLLRKVTLQRQGFKADQSYTQKQTRRVT